MKALQNRKALKPYMLLFPSLFTLYLLIGTGVVSALIETLKKLDNSAELFSSSDFYTSLGLSLRLAVMSTAGSGLMAIFILYGLFCLTIEPDHTEIRNPGSSKILLKKAAAFVGIENLLTSKVEKRSMSTPVPDALSRLFQTPMLVPYIVAGYLIFLTFGQSGLISRIFYALRLTDGLNDFPILTNDPGGYGIMVAFIWKTTPFMILMLYPAMLSLDRKFLDMSRIFGLSAYKYYWKILIPHMASTIVFSSFIVFAYTLTSFEIPYMLGATYPKTLSVSAYQMYTGGTLQQRDMAMLISLLLFCISLILGIIAFRHTAKYQRHLSGGDSK